VYDTRQKRTLWTRAVSALKVCGAVVRPLTERAFLLVGGKEGSSRCLRVESRTGRITHTYQSGGTITHVVSSSRTNRLYLLAEEEDAIRLRVYDTVKNVQTTIGVPRPDAWQLALSADGRWLATSKGRSVSISQRADGKDE